MTLFRPDWPPFRANSICVSGSSHHLTMFSASPTTCSEFQVVSTNGWPPMLPVRSMLPSSRLSPGATPNADLSDTTEVAGSSTGSPSPTQSMIAPTLPCANRSCMTKMSICPVVATGGMNGSIDR